MEKTSLTIANLEGADLNSANLGFANLRGANLRNADLNSVNLGFANLRGANLGFANLRDANLRGANLRDANLRGANLSSAKLIYFINLTPSQIKSTCYWEKAIYKSYKEENKKYIEELKKEKSSEPKYPVDCSIWER